jgi:hypothetical protein
VPPVLGLISKGDKAKPYFGTQFDSHILANPQELNGKKSCITLDWLPCRVIRLTVVDRGRHLSIALYDARHSPEPRLSLKCQNKAINKLISVKWVSPDYLKKLCLY